LFIQPFMSHVFTMVSTFGATPKYFLQPIHSHVFLEEA